VRRRVEKMLESRAVFFFPIVNPKKAQGVSFRLTIEAEPGSKAEVDRLVASRLKNLAFRATASRTESTYGFNGANVSEGGEALKWVNEVPGVSSARIEIVEGLVNVFGWLRKEIDEYVTGGPVTD